MRRDLAGRAVLIAAGVGTALGAGAGLANAAPLEQDLQQDQAGQNAFDQSLPTDALTGSLPAAPNLGLSDGTMKTQAASPLDLGTVSGGQLSGLLGGLGSNGGNAAESAPADEAGATDSTEAADSSATDSTEAPDSTSTDSAAPATTGDSATDSTSGSTAPASSTGDSPAASSGDSGYTTSYGS